jgi:anti-sigma factor RsiW
MNETTKTNHCERAVELVAYFYGEATRDERASFDAHLTGCAACREELTAFAGVREAVGHWRAEVLDYAPAPLSFADTLAPEASRENVAAVAAVAPAATRRDARNTVMPSLSARYTVVVPKRSARAALREFFTLSPLWLRASVAAAALVVCALAALAVVNAEVSWNDDGLAFNTRLGRSETPAATPAPVAAPAGNVYTQAELDKLVAERDAALRELEDTRAQLDDSRGANLIAAVETLEPASASKPIQTPGASRRERRASPAAQPKRLRNNRDEDDVPRLYDLLIEAN